jgi:hypothetical protein
MGLTVGIFAFALPAPELICWGVMVFLPLNELLALFPRVLNPFT